MTSERYIRGWEKLKEVDGGAGEKVIESLKDIAPDLGRYTIEFPLAISAAGPVSTCGHARLRLFRR